MTDLIDAYAKHLRVLGRAEATIDTYADLLHRLDRDLPYGLYECCQEELVEAIHVARRRPATRALYRAAARAFFAWAADDEGPLDFNPAAYLPAVLVPRGVPRPVSHAQLADILHRAHEPYHLWYLLAAGAGLRCIEISRLDRGHVTADSMLVYGKGGKRRVVPTHPAVWAAIAPLPPGPLARATTGSRATRRQVRDRGNRHLQARLGLPVSMHQLRHHFATAIYRSHGEFVAQQLLGHASPATTAVYAQVASETLVAAVAALPLPNSR